MSSHLLQYCTIIYIYKYISQLQLIQSFILTHSSPVFGLILINLTKRMNLKFGIAVPLIMYRCEIRKDFPIFEF